MNELYRGSELGTISLDLSELLDNGRSITVFRENTSYQVTKEVRSVPGRPQISISSDNMLIVYIHREFVLNEPSELRLYVDRTVNPAEGEVVIKAGMQERRRFMLERGMEQLVIKTGGGEFVISAEQSESDKREQEMSAKIEALEAALNKQLPELIAQALRLCEQDRVINETLMDRYLQVYDRYSAQSEDINEQERQIKEYDELIENAKKMYEDNGDVLSARKKELDEYKTVLRVDEAAIRAVWQRVQWVSMPAWVWQ